MKKGCVEGAGAWSMILGMSAADSAAALAWGFFVDVAISAAARSGCHFGG